MDIVLIFDDNYKRYANITIQSILKHNPGVNIHIIKEPPIEMTRNFAGFDNKLHTTSICYAKLFIQDLFPDLDKVLYLDSDLICLDSLKELYNTPFDGKLIVGCESHDYGKKQAEELGIPRYLNSGVMLLDLKGLREQNISDYVIKNFKKLYGKTLWTYDETIINGLLPDKIKFISEKWNYCYNREYKGREQKDYKIIHFIGKDKEDMFKWQKQ